MGSRVRGGGCPWWLSLRGNVGPWERHCQGGYNPCPTTVGDTGGFIRSSLPPAVWKEHYTTDEKEEWGWRVGRDGGRQEAGGSQVICDSSSLV